MFSNNQLVDVCFVSFVKTSSAYVLINKIETKKGQVVVVLSETTNRWLLQCRQIRFTKCSYILFSFGNCNVPIPNWPSAFEQRTPLSIYRQVWKSNCYTWLTCWQSSTFPIQLFSERCDELAGRHMHRRMQASHLQALVWWSFQNLYMKILILYKSRWILEFKKKLPHLYPERLFSTVI